jgi:hypothetical protein
MHVIWSDSSFSFVHFDLFWVWLGLCVLWLFVFVLCSVWCLLGVGLVWLMCLWLLFDLSWIEFGLGCVCLNRNWLGFDLDLIWFDLSLPWFDLIWCCASGAFDSSERPIKNSRERVEVQEDFWGVCHFWCLGFRACCPPPFLYGMGGSLGSCL